MSKEASVAAGKHIGVGKEEKKTATGKIDYITMVLPLVIVVVMSVIFMAKPERGDIIAVLTTGAYNYAMASNYNRVPRPAMVMIADGKARLVVKRESYEDMMRNEL